VWPADAKLVSVGEELVKILSVKAGAIGLAGGGLINSDYGKMGCAFCIVFGYCNAQETIIQADFFAFSYGQGIIVVMIHMPAQGIIKNMQILIGYHCFIVPSALHLYYLIGCVTI